MAHVHYWRWDWTLKFDHRDRDMQWAWALYAGEYFLVIYWKRLDAGITYDLSPFLQPLLPHKLTLNLISCLSRLYVVLDFATNSFSPLFLTFNLVTLAKLSFLASFWQIELLNFYIFWGMLFKIKMRPRNSMKWFEPFLSAIIHYALSKSKTMHVSNSWFTGFLILHWCGTVCRNYTSILR